MQQTVLVKRTNTSDEDFQNLVIQLDHELWNELQEDQATYDPLNKVPDIKTAVLIYADEEPVACGCFKIIDQETVEVKRMFVKKSHRGKGYAKQVLQELESWASELDFLFAILETSVRFKVAQKLYLSSDYFLIPKYPPYDELPESICMKKKLQVRPASNGNTYLGS